MSDINYAMLCITLASIGTALGLLWWLFCEMAERAYWKHRAEFLESEQKELHRMLGVAGRQSRTYLDRIEELENPTNA